MSNRNVLITGATGFVGTRLAERLVLGTDYNVVAAIHRFTGPGLARLARLPINIVPSDVLHPDSLEKAAENCDIIVHLAYGTTGDENRKREITVSGTENILKLASKSNVRKVIYFSTAAIHGNAPKASVVDESTPFEKSHDVYRESKIEAENIVWHYHKEHGLPVVVFRPPIIYGPYGAYWTARIVKEITSGAILVNGGTGAANLIYVDNLIDAVMLAMEKDAGDGEAFIVVDDDNLTWQNVYEAYAGMLDSHPPIQHMTKKEIEEFRKSDEPNDLKNWLLTPLLLVPEMVRTSLQSLEMRRKMMQIPWVRFLRKRLSQNTLDTIIAGENNLSKVTDETAPFSKPKLPGKDIIELYSSQSRFSNDKIKRILGYKQRVAFHEAFDLTCAWLRYQRLIP